MTWCECLYYCGNAGEYEEEISKEKNYSVIVILNKEFFEECQENHEDCQIRGHLIEKKKTEEEERIRKKSLIRRVKVE